MTSSSIVLLGAGGHARSCIDVIELVAGLDIRGILDPALPRGTTVLGVPCLGDDSQVPRLAAEGLSFLVCVGQMDTGNARKRLFLAVRQSGGALPPIVSPRAYVSRHATVGDGTIVMHGAMVNAGAVIGMNCIVNTGALVEHDSCVGDHCHIATRAVLNGGCRVASNVFVGSQATLREGIEIASNVIIGAGAVVTKTIRESGVYTGVPAARRGHCGQQKQQPGTASGCV